MKFKRVRKKIIKKISRFVCNKCAQQWDEERKAKHEPCFDFLICIDIVRKTK
jgi:predicted metal-binding protein